MSVKGALTCPAPHCTNTLPATGQLGRPPKYCSEVCRKAAWRQRDRSRREAAGAATRKAEIAAARDADLPTAVELVTIIREHPSDAAVALADWAGRRPGRAETLWSLARFMDRHNTQLSLPSRFVPLQLGADDRDETQRTRNANTIR